MQNKHDFFTGDIFECLTSTPDMPPLAQLPLPKHSNALTGAERSRRYRRQKKLRQQQRPLL
jgi:hypothetical protein